MGPLFWAMASVVAGLCGPVVLEGRTCFDGDTPVSGTLPWCYDARVDEETNATLVSCPWGIAVPSSSAARVAPAVCEDGRWRTELVCEAAAQTVWRLRNTGSLQSGWWVHSLEFAGTSCRSPPPPAQLFASASAPSFPVQQAFDESKESGWHADCVGDCHAYIGVRLNERTDVGCVNLRQFWSENYRADNISLETWEAGTWRQQQTWTGLQRRPDPFQILERNRECRQFQAGPQYLVEGVGVASTPHNGEGQLRCADGLDGEAPITVYCNNGVWHPEYYDLKCSPGDGVEYYPLEGVAFDTTKPLSAPRQAWQATSWVVIFFATLFVMLTFGCVLQRCFRRSEYRKKHMLAALRKRAKHFEDLYSSVRPRHREDDPADLEKPRHLRASADQKLGLAQPLGKPREGPPKAKADRQAQAKAAQAAQAKAKARAGKTIPLHGPVSRHAIPLPSGPAAQKQPAPQSQPAAPTSFPPPPRAPNTQSRWQHETRTPVKALSPSKVPALSPPPAASPSRRR